MSGLYDKVNEDRAAQGLNAVSTGKTGKGCRPRQSERPSWTWLKRIGEAGNSIKFEIRPGNYKLVSKKQVEDWESRNS